MVFDIIIANSTIIENNSRYNNNEELSCEEFVNISDTNVTAYFHLLKYLMPSLIKRKQGMIVNLTGTSQSIPTVFKTAYETSKLLWKDMESLSDKLFKEKHKISQKIAQTQSLSQPPSESQLQKPKPNKIQIASNFNIAFTMSVVHWI